MSPYGAPLTHDQLEDWMRIRFGAPDGTPIYWHAAGLVRDALSGEALYTFEYYDVSRQIRDPDRPDVKIGVVRKFDAFRDKETNVLIDSVDGQKVGALLYPYQLFAYQVSDNKVTSLVTQGSGEHVRQIPSAGDVLRKEQGDVVQYTAPSHFPFFHPNMPDFKDFFTITVNYVTNLKQHSRHPLHSWGISIVSRRPPWAGGDGQALVNAVLSGCAYDDFGQLPGHIQDMIRSDLPAWEHPPQDLDDVASLQADPSYLNR